MKIAFMKASLETLGFFLGIVMGALVGFFIAIVYFILPWGV